MVEKKTRKQKKIRKNIENICELFKKFKFYNIRLHNYGNWDINVFIT